MKGGHLNKMARTVKKTIKYGRVRGPKGKVRFRRTSGSKTVTKGPKKSEFLRAIEGMNSGDKLKAIKAKIRGTTAQVGTTAASTATSAVSAERLANAGNVDYSSNYANLNQNVQGGIQQSKNHRDDDEEEDFPGVN